MGSVDLDSRETEEEGWQAEQEWKLEKGWEQELALFERDVCSPKERYGNEHQVACKRKRKEHPDRAYPKKQKTERVNYPCSKRKDQDMPGIEIILMSSDEEEEPCMEKIEEEEEARGNRVIVDDENDAAMKPKLARNNSSSADAVSDSTNPDPSVVHMKEREFAEVNPERSDVSWARSSEFTNAHGESGSHIGNGIEKDNRTCAGSEVSLQKMDKTRLKEIEQEEHLLVKELDTELTLNQMEGMEDDKGTEVVCNNEETW